MQVLSMLKTVVRLNIFVETIFSTLECLFKKSQKNSISLKYNFYNVNVFTITFDQFNALAE